MIRADKLIFGYVIFNIAKKDISYAAELLLTSNVSAKISSEGSFISSASQKRFIESIFKGKIDYSVSPVKGVYGFFLRFRYRYGIYLAIILSSLLFLFLSGKVWDVRVESNDEEFVASVMEELSDFGLYIGADWSDVDKSRIETGLLAASSDVSWININRRGSVAYISVIKKEAHELPTEPSGYANVIAQRDCIIEDIIVKRGVPVVKVGESVKKGDLLISGIIPTELGGGFCYAEGEIRGRYSDQICAEVLNTETVKIYSEDYTQTLALDIFDFSINIFKRYGNLPSLCDIIEEKSDFSLPGGKMLPFSVTRTKIREYSFEERLLTKAEVSDRASNMLKENLNQFLSDKELLSINTSGEFFDKGYRMFADMVLCGNVAKITEFEYNSEK